VRLALNPALLPTTHSRAPNTAVQLYAGSVVEDLLEFMFGASGRINRAKYWRSLLILGVAGLFTAIILFTAAGLAAPLFIIMLAVVFIPWLMWGFAIHTERLHDRDKSAWWLLLFCGLPAVLGHLAKAAWFAAALGHSLLQPVLALTGFVLTIWGFVEIALLPGTAGSNRYGANPLLQASRTARSS
jgi:uncharacterized membrane protein YhaH (DUF805 family)